MNRGVINSSKHTRGGRTTERKSKMPKPNVLVTYSSGYGATKEVAEEVVKAIENENEFKVDIKNIDNCTQINDYDVVVIGSSVRADLPLANTRDFISEHRFELTKKRVALFIVSITASIPEGVDIAKSELLTHLRDRYPWISPVSIAAFGGRINFEKLNPVMQSLVRNVMKEKGLDSNGSFDARNWDEIRSWAKKLAFKLKESS